MIQMIMQGKVSQERRSLLGSGRPAHQGDRFVVLTDCEGLAGAAGGWLEAAISFPPAPCRNI